MSAAKVHRRAAIARVVLAICFVSVWSHAYAQTIGTGGVYIDPEGVLRTRATDHPRKTLRRPAERSDAFHYVSLKQVLEQAKKYAEDGRELPDDLRYLGGIVKLKYVIAYPQEQDLVIAGPAEPIKPPASPSEPAVGRTTGRPALCLDDLVVCLRAVERRRGVFGCSIDLPPDATQRVANVAAQIGAVRSAAQLPRIQRAFADAIGLQPIRVFGVPAEQRVARVCIEADYIMKRLALGLDPSPVRGVKSQAALRNASEPVYSRFWFSAFYEPLLMSEDGNTLEIRGQGLQVFASDSPTGGPGNASVSAKRFAEQLTEHFPELSRYIVQFADLWNVTDLAVLAALIRHDRLDERCGVELNWLLDDDRYRVPTMETPKSVDTVAIATMSRRKVDVMIGGVTLEPRQVVVAERESSAELSAIARRPVAGEWLLRGENPQ